MSTASIALGSLTFRRRATGRHRPAAVTRRLVEENLARANRTATTLAESVDELVRFRTGLIAIGDGEEPDPNYRAPTVRFVSAGVAKVRIFQRGITAGLRAVPAALTNVGNSLLAAAYRVDQFLLKAAGKAEEPPPKAPIRRIPSKIDVARSGVDVRYSIDQTDDAPKPVRAREIQIDTSVIDAAGTPAEIQAAQADLVLRLLRARIHGELDISTRVGLPELRKLKGRVKNAVHDAYAELVSHVAGHEYAESIGETEAISAAIGRRRKAILGGKRGQAKLVADAFTVLQAVRYDGGTHALNALRGMRTYQRLDGEPVEAWIHRTATRIRTDKANQARRLRAADEMREKEFILTEVLTDETLAKLDVQRAAGMSAVGSGEWFQSDPNPAADRAAFAARVGRSRVIQPALNPDGAGRVHEPTTNPRPQGRQVQSVGRHKQGTRTAGVGPDGRPDTGGRRGASARHRRGRGTSGRAR